MLEIIETKLPKKIHTEQLFRINKKNLLKQTFYITRKKNTQTRFLSILFAAAGSKGDKKHQCTTCSKRFASFKSLLMHFNIHKGLTKCHICDAVLSRTGNLKRHIRLKHSNLAIKSDDDTIKIETTS